jgi:general secretion pathway protein E/type IV pilus assembly protein PilB
MAQRLVRTLCPECRQPFTPTENDVPDDFPLTECLGRGEELFCAVGCRQCRGTGYSGRVGLYELLTADDEVRRLANERTPTNLVKRKAMDTGMRTLREDGWLKVRRGQTTVDEVLRVTKAD